MGKARGNAVAGAAAIGLLAALFGGWAVLAQTGPAPGPVPVRLAKPYLGAVPLAGILAVSPAPPAPGSAAEARDIEATRAALKLRGGPRWTQAAKDADLFSPAGTGALSCAAGIAIGPATTPGLDNLLRRAATDLGLSGSAIKRRYQRPRPFMLDGQPTCTPEWEAILRRDGSYPSGHSAIGYGWALILSQLLPDRAAVLVARGRAFGDSRWICNVHWLSDVEEGRVVGAMTVARLNADPAFRRELDSAAAELRGTRAPPRDCDREAKALDSAAPAR
jgi:acid phosphatase (class A)